MPFSVMASWLKSGSLPSAAKITGLIGKLYLVANSQSRASWPGTAITAPVP
ncbi:Uncharacterised protein [Yersinia enterocolitica]|nr:Uncharacterised protein [Yersinia enterocolitica]